ncbi:MAG: hypothetical protein OXC01_07855 [Immundisolibacterales bacterium]|nr:hypothetical protein [Immundisolibacterales bacterium]
MGPDWVIFRPSGRSSTGTRPSGLNAVMAVVPSLTVSGSPSGIVKTGMPRWSVSKPVLTSSTVEGGIRRQPR